MSARPLMGAALHGARQALQWRLLALWLAALALPTLLAALPMWAGLSGLLDKSLLGRKLVEGAFEVPVLAETIFTVGARGAVQASVIGAAVVYLLLLPWLTGTALAAARTTYALGFGALLQGGLREYGRMARLYALALLPLGLAFAAGSGVSHLVKEQALTMTLESEADWLGRASLVLSALLLLLAHATVDAARAQLAIEPRQTSVVKAWWRGLRGLRQRPGRLLVYGGVTAAGLLLAALLALLRVQVAPVGFFSFVAALLLGQLFVATLAWMRCARLFALVAAARA